MIVIRRQNRSMGLLPITQNTFVRLDEGGNALTKTPGRNRHIEHREKQHAPPGLPTRPRPHTSSLPPRQP